MGSMDIGAKAARSAGLSAAEDSPPDFEFESSPASWTWDTSHLDFGLGGPVIPPPPCTALSSCSAIPPPPSTALSGSVIPPPPSTVLPGSVIPPPPRTGG
jgi:hypothetical protein